MNIGIFDSGIGGLIVTRALTEALPEYNYIYYGDTLHVPYGGRSPELVYQLSRRAVSLLFEHDCALVIVACNTASAVALRRLQQIDLPKWDPHRRILGMVIPTAEEVVAQRPKRVGLLATQATVNSAIYEAEIHKLDSKIQLFTQAAPLLVPMIEHDGREFIQPVLRRYLQPLLDQNIEALILGCTHYPFLRRELMEILGEAFPIFSQDEIIPNKLSDYLGRHSALEKKLGKKQRQEYLLSDLTPGYEMAAQMMFGQPLNLTPLDPERPGADVLI